MRTLYLLPVLALALAVRCYFIWDEVFWDGLVRFGGNDPWYHMRQVEYLVANFPHRLTHDPYGFHPGGQAVAVAPLFDYLLATIALVAGLGSPSPRTVELVGVWAPAVLGALIPVPVYLLARRLAGEAAGWVAAGLVAILPGQILSRSSLGFADHHVLETFLVAWLVYLLARALDRADASGVSFADLRAGARAALRRPAVDGAIVGVVLWSYLATWIGGGVVLLLLAAWIVVQVHVAHLRGARSDDVALVCVPAFGVALLLMLATSAHIPKSELHVQGLVVLLALSAALPAVSARLAARGAARWWLPAAVALLAAIALGILHAARPQFLGELLWRLSWFRARGLQFTVGEAQPLLMVLDEFTWRRAWHFFGAGLIYVPVALLALSVRTLRSGRPARSLVLVWTVVMVLLTLGQNRFAYYSSVNVAVMAGLLFGPLLAWAWREAESGVAVGILRQVVLPLAVLGAVFGPPIPEALLIAGRMRSVESEWRDALAWMRTETPEPFDDPDLYHSPELARGGKRLKSDYGVLCWWNNGYYVTRLARRVPASNATQAGARTVGRLYLNDDMEAVIDELEERRLRYVIAGAEMAIWNPLGGVAVLGQARDIAGWAGGHPSDLYEVYVFTDGKGRRREVPLFYPGYFRSLLYRLSVLGGEAYEPRTQSAVVAFRREASGTREVLHVTDYRAFETESEARAHLATLRPGTARLVSRDPFESCVALEAVPRLREVHRSRDNLMHVTEGGVPLLRVFELTPEE